MRRIALLLWVVFQTTSTVIASDLSDDHIYACGDAAGWPPFHFMQNGLVHGFDIDVLERILPPAGIDFSVTLVPWQRCLNGSKDGWFHILLSASTNPEREQTYALTDSYYTLSPSYVYNSHRFPEGLNIEGPEDLSSYRVCGLRGYNYTGFGIPNTEIDRSSNTFAQVSQKTLNGDCDLFLVRYEVLVGFSPTREPVLIQGLAEHPFPGGKSDRFYLMVPKAYPHHEALVALLNQGIREMSADGTLDELLSRYLPDQ